MQYKAGGFHGLSDKVLWTGAERQVFVNLIFASISDNKAIVYFLILFNSDNKMQFIDGENYEVTRKKNISYKSCKRKFNQDYVQDYKICNPQNW